MAVRVLSPRFEIHQCASEHSISDFATAVVLGLSDRPRWTPARFLYDAEGSRLFEEITRTPEYYLTRLEAELLERYADEIIELAGERTIVELGSGSAGKIEWLLSASIRRHGSARYVPVDVSEDALRRGAGALTRRYPELTVRGIHGTYEAAFRELPRMSPLTLVFLGSTVGNLNQNEALHFWRHVSDALAPDDRVLLGVDLAKDPAVINAAYNDAAGVSAAFTRNLFTRMNRELGAGLDLDAIRHEAMYRADWRRVEISALFTRRQTLRVGPLGQSLVLEAGDRIMTEISRKFDLVELQRYLACFGLETIRAFADEQQWYAVLLLRRRADETKS